ncbi:toll/interleukin-1 receptor domain-containing protein [Ruminiclostridium herbifermentans]|uniref:Toll/interleukin-1 receptor domain-containing protein n=1 Tax=Ruminiclostridium herbifermentans TaxID=2488810 RepID=A0A4U7JLE5_9FIRM|nr:toll/interleukin-1 receptor domain-containing protein [Ruminiclostridium herbifermentans]QNU68314.1 toll/interleukin-1 receptor domain-containing protein [Ruminiclostridium herbifermentans]
MEKAEAIRKLSDILWQIETIYNLSTKSSEFIKWKTSTQTALKYIFGDNSSHIEDFIKIRYLPSIATINTDYTKYYNQGLDKAKAILESFLDEIKEYWKEDSLDNQSKIKDSNFVNENSIFLAYSYRPEDDEFVAGFKSFLEHNGYNVVDGKADRLGSISKAILDKISKAKYAVIIMTKRDKKENGKYTTAAWLLEEKGAALALGKNVAMFVEEGIDENDIGGLQGDSQRFHFTRNNFMSKAMEFIKCI